MMSIIFVVLVIFLVHRLLSHLPRTFCIGIPAVGHSGLFTSYLGSYRFYKDAVSLLKEGHQKYPGRPFQIPHVDRWVVYITDQKLVKEISTIPSSHLSLLDATNDVLQVEYTGIHQEQQIIDIIKNRLVRNLSSIIPLLHEEAQESFSNYIPLTEEWKGYHTLTAMSDITACIASRMFVGLPKAHDKEYTQLSSKWAHSVIITSAFLNIMPKLLRPLLCWVYNPSANILRRICQNLTPLIKERRDLLANGTLGKDDGHNDLLSWIVQGDLENAMNPMLITRKLLPVNFAAIHTTSSVITHALYYLAVHPQYTEPLRAEMEDVLMEGEGSKRDLDRMYLLDSFLKETLRLRAPAAVSMLRKAIEPITLSDGSYIPAGTLIMVSPLPIHTSSSSYKGAEEFDGFRFSREGSQQKPNQMITPTLDYFPFGYGPLACPGRQVAVSLLKVMLMQILLNYDIKLQDSTTRPPDRWLGTLCFPDDSCHLLFRKRNQ